VEAEPSVPVETESAPPVEEESAVDIVVSPERDDVNDKSESPVDQDALTKEVDVDT
jgi:hypothetical protein